MSHNLVKIMEQAEGSKENPVNETLLPTSFQSSEPTAWVKTAQNNWTQLFTENQHFSMDSEWILQVTTDFFLL